MPFFALDANVMIAAVCAWHEHHDMAVDAIEQRFRRRLRLLSPVHALVETYAVLTRLPAPHRLAPEVAWTLVHANFVERATVVAASVDASLAVLANLAQNSRGGGRTYDALIAATAGGGGARELLTFNPAHFDDYSGPMAIVGL